MSYLELSLVQLLSLLFHIPLLRFSRLQTHQSYGRSLQVIHSSNIGLFSTGNIFIDLKCSIMDLLACYKFLTMLPCFVFFYSALLSWIAFPACLFQVQELCFTQVWKGCWKLFSSDYCYTVSLLVLHFKATTKHFCPYFRLVNVLNLLFYLFYKF